MKNKRYFFIIFLFLGHLCGFNQVTQAPFADEIRKFMENDRINPPPRHAILFAGSSSFTMWRDVKDYFPGFAIINRGFGGSTLPDQVRYADSIIFPYAPRQIVIYCGENDLAAADTVSAEMVTARFKDLFNLIRSKLPGVKITYVSIKPSPSRWRLAEKFTGANSDIRKFLKTQTNTSFVNIWKKMLNENHLPDTTLFLEDRLHMNAKGYSIWQKTIKPQLIK
jgi:lysophospholipase L1-like esterase